MLLLGLGVAALLYLVIGSKSAAQTAIAVAAENAAMNAAAGVSQIRQAVGRAMKSAATLRRTKSMKVYLQENDQECSSQTATSWGSSWTRRVVFLMGLIVFFPRFFSDFIVFSLSDDRCFLLGL